LGRSATETSETLQVVSREQTVGSTQVLSGFSEFRSSVTSAEDANTWKMYRQAKRVNRADKVKEVLLKNRRMTLCEVANVCVSISLGNFGGNLYVLPIATKFAPYLLSEEQKEKHVNTQQNLQERFERDSEPIANTITADTTQGGITP
jgi:hypothetical protein